MCVGSLVGLQLVYEGIPFSDPSLMPDLNLDMIVIGSFTFIDGIREAIEEVYGASTYSVPEVVGFKE